MTEKTKLSESGHLMTCMSQIGTRIMSGNGLTHYPVTMKTQAMGGIRGDVNYAHGECGCHCVSGI